MKRKAVVLADKPDQFSRVYSEDILAELRGLVDLHDILIGRDNLAVEREALQTAEAAFSTWSMPQFSEPEIKEYMPRLKAVFYAAGSVQAFARPFLDSGVKIVSAWAANAVPVAEYTEAQIILANKGFYQNLILYKQKHSLARKFSRSFPGNYDVKVGILGAGMIGTLVINRLKSHDIDVMVFDPFLTDARAGELGVVKAGLVEVFSECQTISNHMANNEQTVGILNKAHFDVMLDNATFINTGRGAQVVESDLVQALKAVPTRTAVLDVTWPSSMKPDNELMQMDNIFLTSHIAGSSGNETIRMARYMMDEFARYERSEPLKHEVTLDMLATMA